MPQRNEILSLFCTALGFICKNEEYNPKENIPNGRYLENLILLKVVKVGLSPSKNFCVICFIESPLKMIKNSFFILKALFVLQIFKFLSWLFSHVGKIAWLERYS